NPPLKWKRSGFYNMKKIIVAVLVSLVFLGSAAAVSGESEPVEVNLSVDAEKYRFYSGSNTIGFPSVMSGGEPAKYKNASYREFASWEVSEKGIEKVRDSLNQKLGELKGVTTGSTPDTIEITYVMNGSLDRVYTYQELVAATPSKVEGTVSFPGEQVTVSVPVEVRKVSADERAKSLAYGAGEADAVGGFGSSDASYNTSFEVVDTITGNHTGNRIEDISTGRKHVEFTGYVEVANPCVKLSESYEKKEGKKIVLNVSTKLGSGFCTQVVAMKKYRFSMNASESFQLEVIHDGESVRNLTPVVSHPNQDKNINEPFYSFILGVRDFLADLFS
ncbi:MAG: hypothetical protein ABEJ72_00315, partial [Candidatus Aenigmatarchaeota archaeon]